MNPPTKDAPTQPTPNDALKGATLAFSGPNGKSKPVLPPRTRDDGAVIAATKSWKPPTQTSSVVPPGDAKKADHGGASEAKELALPGAEARGAAVAEFDAGCTRTGETGCKGEVKRRERGAGLDGERTDVSTGFTTSSNSDEHGIDPLAVTATSF